MRVSDRGEVVAGWGRGKIWRIGSELVAGNRHPSSGSFQVTKIDVTKIDVTKIDAYQHFARPNFNFMRQQNRQQFSKRFRIATI